MSRESAAQTNNAALDITVCRVVTRGASIIGR